MTDLEEYAETLELLIRDRDAKFVAPFDAVFHSVDIKVIETPVQPPRANAIMERWIGSCRMEILDRTLIWNLPHLHVPADHPHRSSHGASTPAKSPQK